MRSLAAILALLAASGLSAGEMGRPLLQTISNSISTRLQVPTAPLQDSSGRLYIADFSVTVVLDGDTGSSIEMPFAKSTARLAQSADGTMYTGGHGQLGYLRSLPGDQHEFIRIDNRLAPNERSFGDVQVVAAASDGTICFAATRKLLLWRSGAFSVIDHGGARAWAVGPDIYLHRDGGPLRQLVDGRIVAVSADPFFAETKLACLLSGGAPGDLLIGTLDRGLFRWAGGAVTAIPTEVDNRLRREHLTSAVRRSDGSLALGLADGNVVLLGSAGQFLCGVGTSDGLPATAVGSLGLDKEDGLWIAQLQHLARLQWPSGVSLFDDKNGLPRATVRSVLRYAGILYASTAAGVYRLLPGSAGENAHFESVPGGIRTIRSLVAGPSGLLGVTASQVLELRGASFAPVLSFTTASQAAALTLVRSTRNPDRIWIGQFEGLRSIRRQDDHWIDEGLLPGFTGEIDSMMEDADGALWIANATDGFARVRYEASSSTSRGTPRVDRFYGGHGLPAKMAGNNSIVLWQGAPLFPTDYAVYRFDPRSESFSPFTEAGPELNEPPMVVSNIIPGSDDHFWLRAYTTPPGPAEVRGRRFFYIPRHGPWRALPHFANDAVGTGGYSTIEEGPPGQRVLWLPGQGGLLRVEVEHAFPEPRLWPVVVSSEAAAPGETWSDEMPAVDATDPRIAPNAITLKPTVWIAAHDRIPFRRRSLRFHYTAPRLQLGAAPEYQTILEGLDTDWSGLRPDHSRTVTNLPAGPYRLRVRAVDSDGRVTPESVFAFAVLPPWWQTWWAYSGSTVLTALALAGTVRWRVRALERRNQRLETTVEMRTQQLRQSEDELRAARDSADAANRAKSAFLANMSHELRTPLNSILGYTQIMQRESAPDGRNVHRLEHVAQSGEHLLRLINDVLDLSKVEAGRTELDLHPCSLRKLIGSLAEFFQARATLSGLGFILTQPTPLPEWVLADEHRLRQVLSNLLGNALKFTEHGHIELRVEDLGGKLRFAVIDTGVGIAATEQPRIFRPFQQAALPHLAAQGAGLGLAISHHLVELMGGQLEVESTPGKGSRFSFEIELPLAPRLEPRAGSRTIIGYRGERRRILVVDDEADNRALLRDLLAGLAFDVLEADGADAALAVCTQTKPDAVLLDLRMPVTDGFTLAPRLRRLRAEPFPIIALSASVYPIDREQAQLAGCDEFLAKPIREPDLFAALARLAAIEWTYREARESEINPALPLEQLALPRAARLEELLALAECGDVLRLAEVLVELRRDEPSLAPFTTRIDGLAAAFKLKELRELLQRARELAAATR